MVAEMVKLLENTFRATNIALVNEIAIMCDRLGVDVWEVISKQRVWDNGVFPHRNPVKFLHVILPENRDVTGDYCTR